MDFVARNKLYFKAGLLEEPVKQNSKQKNKSNFILYM